MMVCGFDTKMFGIDTEAVKSIRPVELVRPGDRQGLDNKWLAPLND